MRRAPGPSLWAAEVSVERSWLARPVLEVAPDLLGCVLTAHGVSVRLTEIEAYAGETDPGSHAFRGPTPRTQVMFGDAGHLYVYLSYGMHLCANLVTGEAGSAAAVLLRAGEVVAGHEIAAARRPGIRERDWARGPGRLGATLGLRREDNGVDVIGGDAMGGDVMGGDVVGANAGFHLERGEPIDPASIETGPRVGVSGPGGAADAYPWRFWIAGDPTVSAYRPGRL